MSGPGRIAYVWVPRFALQAVTRADPELAAAPLAIVDRDGKQLIEVSVEAARLGLRRGLTATQARALAPEAILRQRSPELERAAEAALGDLGAAFSPRIEPAEGAVALDVADLGRLFADEGQLASALWVGARKLGLAAQVGLARDRVTARIAALAAERDAHGGASSDGAVQVVPPGREAAFLARLPVRLLSPWASPELMATLERWGVRAIGELASLPKGGLALRLGEEGARLARVARGESHEPLVPRPEPLVFEEGIDLEWPVEDAEALLFVLKRLVDRLLERLACRGLSVGGLELRLGLERSLLDASARAGGALDVRLLPVAAPTRESSTVLQLARLDLEQKPPAAPVTALVVRAEAGRSRAAQLGLFEPAGPSPDRLATLLARLHALVGEGHAGAPALVDRHRPDAFAVGGFDPATGDRRPATGHEQNQSEGLRRLAVHAYRPARAAEVRLDRGRLRWVSADGLGGQVIAQAGPFRLREGWWLGENAVQRDYYDVELSDGAIYRLYQELPAGAWLVDGCYE